MMEDLLDHPAEHMLFLSTASLAVARAVAVLVALAVEEVVVVVVVRVVARVVVVAVAKESGGAVRQVHQSTKGWQRLQL